MPICLRLRRSSQAPACRFVTLLLIGLTLASCKKKQGVIERPPPLVTVAEAIAQDVPAFIDRIGACTAREVVAVKPQASGQIVAIHFADGADLKQGDLLFTIDSRPYQAALAQAQAGLAQDEASLALAELEFARVQRLLPAKEASQEEYDLKRNAVAVAKAQIQASQAQIETARINLGYTTIRSPIDGRAGKREVDVGNVVTAAGGPTLLVIQRLDPIYADFVIPEQDLGAVRRQMAKGTLKTLVRLPEEPLTGARQGDLTFLDNAVQTGTGTVALRATLPNADHHFWPGQFVHVRLVLDILKDAVVVPYQAAQIGPSGPYVYVVGPDATTELRLVKLGQRQGEGVVVGEGLQPGQKVVTHGQIAIRPGGKVRVEPASQPAAGPATPTRPSPQQAGGTP